VHHDEHGCADYGSASDSVSELPRSFIGISRFREIPIPASAISGIDHHHKHHHHDAPTRPRHPRLRARAHMLPRADAVPRPHGLACCTCRIGSALHPPSRSVHVVPRSTSGIGQRAPAAVSITQSRTLWVTAGNGSALALQATLSRSPSARCCGAARPTAPVRRARSARVRPLLPHLRGSILPYRHPDWAHPSICTGTGLNPPRLHRGLGPIAT
jgi:hypothetical protein